LRLALVLSKEAAKAMRNRIRSNSLYLVSVRGLVVKEGEREKTRWSLKS
jgi:hypothetical protein